MADEVLLIVINLFSVYIAAHYLILSRREDDNRQEMMEGILISAKTRRKLIFLAWFLLLIALNVSCFLLQKGEPIVRVCGMLFIAFTLVLEALFVGIEENSIKQYQKINERLLGSQAEYYERQYEAIAGFQETMRKQRHEWKNRNLMLLSLAKKQDYEEIIRVIEEEQTVFHEQVFTVNSGNFTVDAVLNYETEVAKRQNTEVKLSISVPSDMDVNDTILCGVLGNAMDNAIDAAMHLPPEKRQIEFLMKVEKHNLFIEVKNRFDGVVAYSDGRLLSRKEDSKNHGIGIRVMEEMIRRVNGTIETFWDEEWFTLRVVIYHVI